MCLKYLVQQSSHEVADNLAEDTWLHILSHFWFQTNVLEVLEQQTLILQQEALHTGYQERHVRIYQQEEFRFCQQLARIVSARSVPYHNHEPEKAVFNTQKKIVRETQLNLSAINNQKGDGLCWPTLYKTFICVTSVRYSPFCQEDIIQLQQ